MPKPPVSKSKAAAAYLAKTSPRFREIHKILSKTMHTLFPEAEPAFAFGMPGWQIPRRGRIDPRSVRGTIDPNWVQIYTVERKSGVTLHLWNPVDFGVLRRRRAELSRAGFKVMVGCIQLNRKSNYPTGVVEALLKDVRRSLEVDADKPGATRP